LWFARIASPATVGSAQASTRLRRRVNDVDRRLCELLAGAQSIPDYEAFAAATFRAASTPCSDRTFFTSAWSAFESFRSADMYFP
jgi:hypothetical protein